MLRVLELVRAGDLQKRIVAQEREVRLRDVVEHRELLVREVALRHHEVLARLALARVDAPEVVDEEVEGDVRRELAPVLVPREVARAVRGGLRETAREVQLEVAVARHARKLQLGVGDGEVRGLDARTVVHRPRDVVDEAQALQVHALHLARGGRLVLTEGRNLGLSLSRALDRVAPAHEHERRSRAKACSGKRNHAHSITYLRVC